MRSAPRRAPVTAVLGCFVAAALLALSGCAGAPDPTPPGDSGTDVRTGRDPAQPFQIAAADLGIHSFSTRPDLPTGSIRLNCYPGWSQVAPTQGEYEWVDFDRVVAEAEQWGYADIVYVFCSTPPWAGEPASGPDAAAFGPGTAQAPAPMTNLQDYVRAVAERYRGRIDGYEVWNEPGSAQFFTGTPRQMGQMTEIVKRTVDEVDPAAYVVSAGFQTHGSTYDSFAPEYFDDLRARGWPVDAVSAHFYPVATASPRERVAQMMRVQRDLGRFGAPADIALWDTEVNFDVDSPGGAPDGRITGSRAAAWTAQAYLDGWRTGLRRTYWYLWTAEYYDFPGIQMRLGDPSTRALQILGQWTIGNTFLGCDPLDDGADCRFAGPGGTQFRIAWSNLSKGVDLAVPPNTTVCPVDGSACSQQSGRVRATQLPIRIG